MNAQGMMVDTASRKVRINGAESLLTQKELELLLLLLAHPNEILSREKILRDVWGYSFLGQSRTIDMHIQKLRRKLHLQDRIKTYYAHGYSYVT